MRYDTPQLFVWDKNGNEVRIGDTVEWMSEAWDYGRKRRPVQGVVTQIKQYRERYKSYRREYPADGGPIITRLQVRSSTRQYRPTSTYDRPVYVSLSNFGNVRKV